MWGNGFFVQDLRTMSVHHRTVQTHKWPSTCLRNNHVDLPKVSQGTQDRKGTASRRHGCVLWNGLSTDTWELHRFKKYTIWDRGSRNRPGVLDFYGHARKTHQWQAWATYFMGKVGPQPWRALGIYFGCRQRTGNVIRLCFRIAGQVTGVYLFFF